MISASHLLCIFLHTGIDVTVTQPDGTVLDSSYPGYTLDVDYKRVEIAIQGIAQVRGVV